MKMLASTVWKPNPLLPADRSPPASPGAKARESSTGVRRAALRPRCPASGRDAAGGTRRARLQSLSAAGSAGARRAGPWRRPASAGDSPPGLSLPQEQTLKADERGKQRLALTCARETPAQAAWLSVPGARPSSAASPFSRALPARRPFNWPAPAPPPLARREPPPLRRSLLRGARDQIRAEGGALAAAYEAGGGDGGGGRQAGPPGSAPSPQRLPPPPAALDTPGGRPAPRPRVWGQGRAARAVPAHQGRRAASPGQCP